MPTDISHVFQRHQLRIGLLFTVVTVAQLVRPGGMSTSKLDQISFLSSIFPTIALVLGFVAPFQLKIKGCTFLHWLIDCCSTSTLAGLVAMPIPIKLPEVSLCFVASYRRLHTYTHTDLYPQYPPHPTLKSTLFTPPSPTPLDIPISQRPHPTYEEKSRAVYQSRQAAKLRLDALNAPAAVRYRESHGPAVHAIFRRNNEMSAVDRKAFERRRDYKYKTWEMRRLSPLRYETKVEYDDLEEPGYYLRHHYISPVPYDWRSYPARVPLHPKAWSTENNGRWGPKRTYQTVGDLAGDLPRVRPIPKLPRLGFVDLGPPIEKKRFPSAMEVYLTSCKLGLVGFFGFKMEMPFIGTDRCRSLRLIIDSGPDGEWIDQPSRFYQCSICVFLVLYDT
jgi:hypothetical protein